MYKRAILTGLTALVLTVIYGCSSEGSHKPQSTKPGNVNGHNPITFAELGLDFATPSELTARITSLDDDWLKLGADYESELPYANVSVEETALCYNPERAGSPGQSSTAYAFYAFDIINHPVSTELKLIWRDYPGHLPCWVGLPIPETDEWEWIDLPADCTIQLEDISGFISSGMPLTVGVVLSGLEAHVLDFVRLGPNAEPVAALTATPKSGSCPLRVTLDASESSDSDGDIVRYDWDFDGDGKVDSRSYTQAWTEHLYLNHGEFHPSVTVYDDAGDNHSAFAQLTITPGINYPPKAIATAQPTSGVKPLPVSFDASASWDSDGEIVRYDWDFDGDGIVDFSSSDDPLANFTYEQDGVFIVLLTVTDDGGRTDSAEVPIQVSAFLNQPPVASLTADPAQGLSPLEVTFDASGSTDDGGEIVRYDWDFDGDGNIEKSGDSPLASHVYKEDGRYEAMVRVFDDDGKSDTAHCTVRSGYWMHTWGSEDYDEIVSLVQSDAGELFACGSRDYPSMRDGLLLSYSSAGEFRWVREYLCTEHEIFSAIDIDSAGNVWTAGEILEFDNPSPSNDILLVQVSPTGGFLREVAWGTENIEELRSLQIDSEDNIYLSGYVIQDSDKDFVLVKFDSTADLVWAKIIGNTDEDEIANSSIMLTDNHIALIGSSTGNEGAFKSGILMKLDLDGNLISTDRYQIENRHLGFHTCSLSPDTSMHISGTISEGIPPDTSPESFIMHTNQHGLPLRATVWDADGNTIGCRNATLDGETIYMSVWPQGTQFLQSNVLLAFNNEGNVLWGKQRMLGETFLDHKPGQPLYMTGHTAPSGNATEWITISETSYQVTHPQVTRSQVTIDITEITGNQWTPNGVLFTPEGVLDGVGGNGDAVITTFY